MLTQALTHAPLPPPKKKSKKGPPNGTVKYLKEHRQHKKKKKKKIGGVRIEYLNAFPAVWKTSIFYFFSGGARPRTPKIPSRVSNRPELDENIPILPENPNRDSISVGTQEQLSQANN